MPIVTALLASPKKFHLYIGENGTSPLSNEQLETIRLLGCQLEIHQTAPTTAYPEDVVLSTVDE